MWRNSHCCRCTSYLIDLQYMRLLCAPFVWYHLCPCLYDMFLTAERIRVRRLADGKSSAGDHICETGHLSPLCHLHSTTEFAWQGTYQQGCNRPYDPAPEPAGAIRLKRGLLKTAPSKSLFRTGTAGIMNTVGTCSSSTRRMWSSRIL